MALKKQEREQDALSSASSASLEHLLVPPDEATLDAPAADLLSLSLSPASSASLDQVADGSSSSSSSSSSSPSESEVADSLHEAMADVLPLIAFYMEKLGEVPGASHTQCVLAFVRGRERDEAESGALGRSPRHADCVGEFMTPDKVARRGVTGGENALCLLLWRQVLLDGIRVASEAFGAGELDVFCCLKPCAGADDGPGGGDGGGDGDSGNPSFGDLLPQPCAACRARPDRGRCFMARMEPHMTVLFRVLLGLCSQLTVTNDGLDWELYKLTAVNGARAHRRLGITSRAHLAAQQLVFDSLEVARRAMTAPLVPCFPRPAAGAGFGSPPMPRVPYDEHTKHAIKVDLRDYVRLVLRDFDRSSGILAGVELVRTKRVEVRRELSRVAREHTGADGLARLWLVPHTSRALRVMLELRAAAKAPARGAETAADDRPAAPRHAPSAPRAGVGMAGKSAARFAPLRVRV